VEFSQLRIFQAVAEEGSITRAAERLHRVPSNLSTRLKQLEEQLGVELFVRERQRLQLSPAGKVLLDYTAKLFALHDEAHAAVQGGRTGRGFRARHHVQHRCDSPARAVGALSPQLSGGKPASAVGAQRRIARRSAHRAPRCGAGGRPAGTWPGSTVCRYATNGWC